MNWDHIERDWKRFRVTAKLRWTKIAEEQLHAVAGRRAMLVSRIRDAYAISSDEAERQLADWQAHLSNEGLEA